MNTAVEEGYERFLARAAAALGSAGAQAVLPAPVEQQAALWRDWDQLLLMDNPGAPALYAFTRVGSESARDLGRRIDGLTQDLATRGLLNRGTLNLVYILVAPGGLTPRAARQLARLGPSAYYPGLRPSTVVVELPGGQVRSSGVLRKPPGLDLVQQAAGQSGSVALDPEQINALRQSQVDRRAAFYRLMRGRQPAVTYLLIAVNVVIYLIMRANGALTSDAGLRSYGALSPQLIEHGQWWRLLTSMFLHASDAHILFNMISLLAIGTLAERLYGSLKFLLIYLGAGLTGSLVSFGYAVATGHTDYLAVGASGAIFGIAGALVTVRFQRSDVIPRELRERVSSSMIPLVVLNLVFAHFIPNVDNSAHVGGLLGGMALSMLLPLTRSVSEVR